MLVKILKRRFNVAARPVISNCVTPTKKVRGFGLRFLNCHLKPVMQNKHFTWESHDFYSKI